MVDARAASTSSAGDSGLRLVRACKRYGSTQALRGVDLELRPGRIVAWLGQNGAGKSTAVRIATGVERPDEGRVELDGRAVDWRSAREARAAGVQCVAQELAQLPDLPVEEVLHIGRLPCRGPFVDRARLANSARSALARVGLDLDPRSRLGAHAPATRAMIAVAAALAGEARVLLLDEPTASMDRAQASRLCEHLRELRATGVAMAFVGHRLDEVLSIADEIVVLRDGLVELREPAARSSPRRIAAALVGAGAATEGAIVEPAVQAGGDGGDDGGVQRLQALALASDAPLRPSTFALRAGRVAGVAGLLGSGRSELCLTLAGAVKRAGQVLLDGRPLPDGVGATMDRGLAYAPEERRQDGLWLDLSIEETIALGLARRGGARARGRSRAVAEALVARLGVKCRSIDDPVRSLSGGNQQKVLLARLFAARPVVLVLDEPTRGVDLVARAEIAARVREVAGEGAAVLWTTSHMEELLEVSDDVLLVRDHAVVSCAARAALDLDAVVARLAEGAP
ncbi:MAG: ATP-binding cassette domain-containing protein [Planctomycetia bacterium]